MSPRAIMDLEIHLAILIKKILIRKIFDLSADFFNRQRFSTKGAVDLHFVTDYSMDKLTYFSCHK